MRPDYGVKKDDHNGGASDYEIPHQAKRVETRDEDELGEKREAPWELSSIPYGRSGPALIVEEAECIPSVLIAIEDSRSVVDEGWEPEGVQS